MTPDRADIELLQLRIADLERRVRLQARERWIAIGFAIVLFRLMPGLRWFADWLREFEPAQALMFRAVVAAAIAGGSVALVQAVREAVARRELRRQRERILLSISPPIISPR